MEAGGEEVPQAVRQAHEVFLLARPRGPRGGRDVPSGDDGLLDIPVRYPPGATVRGATTTCFMCAGWGEGLGGQGVMGG